ncbi:MAG TPA: hypothetical protein VFV87_11820 [Pirellulaceae bacterium]|nr:hypothetical protein [Pirellulaceae bacterium]
MANFIPTEQLKASDLPEPMADWHSIVRFASTFDIVSEPFKEDIGWGAENASPEMSLPALRAVIHAEWRRYNHRSDLPSQETMRQVWSVIEWIRAAVSQSS